MTFIVFEGIDGSGKTTQAQLLYNALAKQQGKSKLFRTKEPTDGFYGGRIRKLLSSRNAIKSPLFDWEMAQLFALDRADHLFGNNDFFDASMSDYLADGYTFLCDRYILSSFAYNGQGEMAKLVATLNEGFPVPDLTIYIDVPLEVALKRIAERGQSTDLYEQRLAHYLKGYESAMQSQYSCLGRIVTVNGDRPVDEVHAEILSIIQELEKRGGDNG